MSHRNRRMIGADICTSEKVHKLSWQAKTIFTWMIVRLCDDDGYMDGSPITIKACVVPLDDIGADGVTACLKEMQDIGLIIWYEINGKKYIRVLKWDDFQTFHGIRRIPSKIPPPPTMVDESTHPGDKISKVNKEKLNKEKLSKKKGKKENPEVANATESRISKLTKGLKNIGKKLG